MAILSLLKQGSGYSSLEKHIKPQFGKTAIDAFELKGKISPFNDSVDITRAIGAHIAKSENHPVATGAYNYYPDCRNHYAPDESWHFLIKGEQPAKAYQDFLKAVDVGTACIAEATRKAREAVNKQILQLQAVGVIPSGEVSFREPSEALEKINHTIVKGNDENTNVIKVTVANKGFDQTNRSNKYEIKYPGIASFIVSAPDRPERHGE